MESSSWYHPYSWASRMSQTFLWRAFFSFVLHLFTESSLWGWMQGSTDIFFHFLVQNIHVYYQVPVISNNTKCYQTFLISSFFSATESPFQGSRHYAKLQSKFCCIFVSISLILTNDGHLMQICKHLLTCSPRQWWVHNSLVSPYCLTYLC